MPGSPANPLLEAALLYLERGWSILPVTSGGKWDKRPHQTLKDTGHTQLLDGGTKAAWKLLQTEHPTQEHVKKWFAREGGKGGVTPKTRTEEQGMSPRSARRLISRWRETDNARTNAQPRIQARSP